MSGRSDEHLQIERLLEVGRHEDARALLASCFSRDPDSVENHVLAGRIALEVDDFVSAKEHLSRALADDPQHFAARVHLFVALLELREFVAAESVIIALICEEPGNGELYALYARLMFKTLHLEKTRALLDESLRLSPNSASARLLDVVLAVVIGDRRRASGQLASLVAGDPDCFYVANALMLTLIDAGRYQEALNVAQELIRARPNDRALVERAIELKTYTHWFAMPAWPQRRFGWPGAAAMWAIGFGALTLARGLMSLESWVFFAALYVLWVMHAWTYLHLLRWWIRKRGI